MLNWSLFGVEENRPKAVFSGLEPMLPVSEHLSDRKLRQWLTAESPG